MTRIRTRHETWQRTHFITAWATRCDVGARDRRERKRAAPPGRLHIYTGWGSEQYKGEGRDSGETPKGDNGK